jgi:hypothetical protein
MNVSRNLNNLSRFSGGMEGGNMTVWIILGLVALVGIFVVMWQYEFFGCISGKTSVDNKCVNWCPEGSTYKITNFDGKTVTCADDKTNFLFVPSAPGKGPSADQTPEAIAARNAKLAADLDAAKFKGPK